MYTCHQYGLGSTPTTMSKLNFEQPRIASILDAVPSLVPSLPSDGRLEVDLEADESDGGGDDEFIPAAYQFGGKWKAQPQSSEVTAH